MLSMSLIVSVCVGLGLTGVPVFNVNNNCSSGSSALMMARHLVQAGHECTMAVGMYAVLSCKYHIHLNVP